MFVRFSSLFQLKFNDFVVALLPFLILFFLFWRFLSLRVFDENIDFRRLIDSELEHSKEIIRNM